VLGHINEDVLRSTGANPAGEWPLGDLIADAQLADRSTVTGGQVPVIAFMNPGGIRTELTYASSKYGEAPGDVTYEEAFNVQPFNNYLVSMTLTGQGIYDVLNQQITGANVDNGKTFNKILQVSDGFSYAYTKTGTPHVIDGSVTLNGTAIDKAASYRIVTNNFLADGGDGFPAFRGGTGVYFGGLDIDAFANYLSSFTTGYTPGALDRISIQ
jgi:5'-nucleotidase